ncbi:MAG: alpha/beta fold hydrolase [Oscillospiraceae bacterium]|nr:alpha/beta fold hydrolase [Oscillospiraceae bacterium]
MENFHAPSFLENPQSDSIVVFIHGFMGSPRQFDGLAKAVHMNGFNAAILLLPGHGGSLRDFSSSKFKQWQNHVWSEIKRFSRNYENIWLVGHSMGGLLALCAAENPNNKVRGVFPIASPFKLTALSKRDIHIRLIQVLCADANFIKAAYIGHSSVPHTLTMLFSALGPMVQVKKLMHRTKAILHNIHLPVMAVYSAFDEIISIKSLDILKQGLTRAPFEHVILNKSLHAYYTKKERAIIEKTLLGFIQK